MLPGSIAQIEWIEDGDSGPARLIHPGVKLIRSCLPPALLEAKAKKQGITSSALLFPVSARQSPAGQVGLT